MVVSSVAVASGSFFGASPAIMYIGNLYLNIIGILPIPNGGSGQTAVSGSGNLVLQTSPTLDSPTFSTGLTMNSGANLSSIVPSGTTLNLEGTASILLAIDGSVTSNATTTNFQTSISPQNLTQSSGSNSFTTLSNLGYNFTYFETSGTATYLTITGYTPSQSGGWTSAQIGNMFTMRIQKTCLYGGTGNSGQPLTMTFSGTFPVPANNTYVWFYSASFTGYSNPICGLILGGTAYMTFTDLNKNPVYVWGGNNYNLTGTVSFNLD